MPKAFRSLIALTVALLLSPSPSHAKGPKITDPEKAGVDYQIQGEYVGELQTADGKETFGVQVIALGDGEFRAVGYHGGLPGAGWNGEAPVVVAKQAKRVDGVVEFEDKHGSGRIENGVMACDLGSDGSIDGKLKRVVRKSPTLGKEPPKNSTVLFDGRNVDHWQNGRMTEDGLLMEGTTSKQSFGSHHLHIEFRLPFQPGDRSQGRGNSGIYVQGRYEVQMLDSFGLEGKHNECGGLYSVKDPDTNMCYPPLTWQTYDIQYTAAKFDDNGKLVANPRISVRHNGVLIHDDVELPGERSTTAAPSKPGPQPGPVYLQNHGCPVRYRNIWVVETDET